MSGKHITPAAFKDLPSVLDTEQAADVLRVSVKRVRELAKSGELRRLTYTRTLLFDVREVHRFLRAATAPERQQADSGT